MIKNYNNFKLYEQNNLRNPIDELIIGKTINFSDIVNYVKYLEKRLKEITRKDDIDEILYVDYDFESKANKLITEYKDLKRFLDELLKYNINYVDQIVTDETLNKELNDFIEEEIENLKIPEWLSIYINKDSTIENLKDNYSLVEFENKKYYIK